MNLTRLLSAALVLVTGVVTDLAGQTGLTMQDAERRFSANSLEMRAARSRLRSGLGDARQLPAISNPTFTFTNEDLGDYSERYFNLNQPIDFLWERGARSDGSAARTTAAGAAFAADSSFAILGLRRTHIEAWHRRRVAEAMSQGIEILDGVLEDVTERVAEGDLAPFDLRRMRIAQADLGRRLSLTEVELADAERRLGALIAGDGSIPRTRAEPPPALPTLPDIDATAMALQRRPELAEAEAQARIRDAESRITARSWLSGTSITGGWKQQSDDRDGLFLGVHVPVPIFDRRSAATDAATARTAQAESAVDRTHALVARDAALAAARLSATIDQVAGVQTAGSTEAEALLTAARVAYAEGELSVAEFVDAAEAYLQALLLEADVSRDVWLAFVEFEYAVGGFPEPNGTGGAR